MNQELLFPHRFKKIGWFILIPTFILGILLSFIDWDASFLKTKVLAIFPSSLMGEAEWFSFIETNITHTILGILFIISALMVGFSKEKIEDEYIANLRLSSLLWAVYFNYGILILCFVFIYGLSFFSVMVYNMFTVLIFFIARFNYLLMKSKKTAHEK